MNSPDYMRMRVTNCKYLFFSVKRVQYYVFWQQSVSLKPEQPFGPHLAAGSCCVLKVESEHDNELIVR